MPNEYCLDSLVRMKMRSIGLRALPYPQITVTTSGMKKEPLTRSTNISETRKNGKTQDIQLLICPHMYVPDLSV